MAKPDEVVIITDDACEPCEDLKAKLAGVEMVRFTDLTSEEADTLLGDQEKVFVPMAVARFGERRRVCDIGQDGDQVVLICDGEVIPLKE